MTTIRVIDPIALPALPLESWEQTRATLHLYAQVVGKVRLASTPLRNQWWNVPLYVTARGLTTRRMSLDDLDYDIDLDLLVHRAEVRLCTGESDGFPLRDGLSVRDFTAQLLAILDRFGLRPAIRATPFRMPYSTIPFADDVSHASYDADAVGRFWHALRWVDGVFDEFGGRFRGKQSPIHLFWHSFDLAITRFHGPRIPVAPGTDPVNRVAYDEAVISFGFWPGDPLVREARFYAYAAPEPAGLAESRLAPPAAHWVEAGDSHRADLAWDAVRTAPDPRAATLDFLESVYQAAASAAGWPIGELASPWAPVADRG